MPVRLTSEKFLRAERKNRLENHYLNVTYKHFDKQTVRLNYEIDREKRSISKAFRKVVKTSGASDLGVPPKNEEDRSYETCATYRQGLKLSNKRLYEWREIEKQLNKFITAHDLDAINEKHGKRTKVSRAAKEMYTVIPADGDEDQENDEVFDDNASQISSTSKVSPTDILKSDLKEQDEVFDVKKWEKEIVSSYTNMVCKPVSVKNDGKLRSKSSPSITQTNSEFETGEKSRPRPHTAHARIRSRPASAKSLPPRPMSATNAKRTEDSSKFLITKDSVFMKSGQKFEKLMDNRPVDKPVLVNNYLSTLKPPVPPGTNPDSDAASVSMSSVNGLCTVQEGNEEAEEEADNVSTFGNDVSNGVDAKPSKHLLSPGMKTLKVRHKPPKRTKSSSALSVSSLSTQRSHFKHSNSDLSSYVESNRRTRRDSGSTTCSTFSRALSRTGSTISSHRPSVSLGIPSDISEISKGQDRLAAEISPEKPLSPSKLISVAKVVKCAMTFSKLARQRALEAMQEENSSDSHEIIRQERLRVLQSRQNVLNSIANQWQADDDNEKAMIELVQ